MFKIECSGPYKAGRGQVLVNSLLQHTKTEPDLILVTLEGDIIPTHRSILCLYSSTLPAILSTVPCCLQTALSLPYHSHTIRNLLSLLVYGRSSSMQHKDILLLSLAARDLGIYLDDLEVVENKRVTLEVNGMATIKSLLSQFNTSLQQAQHQQEEGSPLPYEQNDDLSDGGISGSDSGAATKKTDKDKNYGDEVIEITPEMYGITEAEEPEGDEGEDYGALPHHFLMEADGDETADSYGSRADSWMQNMQDTDSEYKAPTVEEVLDPTDPESKLFTCSFCPGQLFKKRNDISRHLKKHVPIEMRKRFQCEQCREKFINNSNLKVHMKVCTGKVKEFKCKKCDEVSFNKTDFLDHLARSHNISKKHSCPICHKQLKKTSDLKKHVQTHSNQKPFACDICGKRFKTESYVKVHRMAHTGHAALLDPPGGPEVISGHVEHESTDQQDSDHIEQGKGPGTIYIEENSTQMTRSQTDQDVESEANRKMSRGQLIPEAEDVSVPDEGHREERQHVNGHVHSIPEEEEEEENEEEHVNGHAHSSPGDDNYNTEGTEGSTSDEQEAPQPHLGLANKGPMMNLYHSSSIDSTSTGHVNGIGHTGIHLPATS